MNFRHGLHRFHGLGKAYVKQQRNPCNPCLKCQYTTRKPYSGYYAGYSKKIKEL